MNKKEAIEQLKQGAMALEHGNGHIIGLEFACKVINQIEDTPKVTIPKFVADWLEWCKKNSLTLSEALSANENNTDDLQTSVNEWFTDNREETFARAWLNGYEIERGPLYNVEIPDPNSNGYSVLYLAKDSNGKILIHEWTSYSSIAFSDRWKKEERANLTEEEIREDFEWAWKAGLAKPAQK